MTETVTRWVGRLLGREELTRIDEADLSFGASWAQDGPGWLLLATAGAAVAAAWFYLRRQAVGRRAGIGLAVLRAAVLSLPVAVLAEPVLELRYTDRPKPLLWLLADGSDSMNLVDDLPSETRRKLAEAAGLPSAAAGTASRADLVRATLADRGKLVSRLAENFRVQAFAFDGTEGVRVLDLDRLREGETGGGGEGQSEDQARSQEASNYDPKGSVTALAAAFDDLRRRYPARDLAGMVVLSDFVQNAGAPAAAAAEELGAPIFAVGLGPTAAADLAVDLDAEPTVKKAERVGFTAVLRQSGLTGRTANVRLTAAPADGSAPPRVVGKRTVSLDGAQAVAEFAVTPDEAGRFTYAVEAESLPGETVAENNVASRNVTVTDDYLRLLFVEYEPTWEWRFVKEVFHRDRLVGLRGFRTYLRSSDPTVRQTNELFLETLPPPRDEFFQYDVIFLGDVPSTALPGRFAEMTKEFVSQFGGGLVVMAGPRFGPQGLAESPIADMLPVVLDADAKRRDEPFRLRLTSSAPQFDFMRLGANETESRQAWENLGELPWYQPVRRVESTAVVLAEHPTDATADGAKQPLIARRPYGAAGGEVVYLGFNETWRLRRKFGEKYYRQFWGQLIYRLGLGHARGADKRFVIDPLPEAPLRPEDEAAFTVRAWDRDFERLTEEDVPGGAIKAEVVRFGSGEGASGGEGEATSISLAMSRPGVFEARVPVYEPGEYRLRATDPVTGEVHEARFRVADVSAERRVATRDAGLQRQLAATVPGGKAYELDEIGRLVDEFKPPRRTRTTTEIVTLWDTWAVFGLVVGLLLAEWLVRKGVNLA